MDGPKPKSAPVPTERRYTAFLSYRHADNREEGRRWAEWLHQAIETYEVPADLVGKPNMRGEPIPASLYPVFRDEEELPADADLSDNIQRALRNSASLIVLCSPRACASRFVDEEIRGFKELGKGDRILALMLDGEPNASDDPAKVELGIAECLPKALRFGVLRENGLVDWEQRCEPIAADVRPEGKPEQGYTSHAAYRNALEKQNVPPREARRVAQQYDEQLQLARLKVIAGLFGVPLGILRARDASYRVAKQRRTIAILVCLLVFSASIIAIAIWQRADAISQRNRAESAIAKLRLTAPISVERAKAFLERGLLEDAVMANDFALVVEPEGEPQLLLKAQLLQASKHFAEAKQAYLAVKMRFPTRQIDKQIALCEELESFNAISRIDQHKLLTRYIESLHAEGRLQESYLIKKELAKDTSELLPIAEARIRKAIGDPNFKIQVAPNGMWDVNLSEKNVRTLEFLEGLPIQALILAWNANIDLQTLPKLPLTYVSLIGCNVNHIEALRGLSLDTLNLHSNNISDLSPLEGMPLQKLFISANPVRDLRPLTNIRLKEFVGFGTQIEDLNPLRKHPIETLLLYNCNVTDFEPLKDMPLKHVSVTDLYSKDQWGNLSKITTIESLCVPADVNLTLLNPFKNLKFVGTEYNISSKRAKTTVADFIESRTRNK